MEAQNAVPSSQPDLDRRPYSMTQLRTFFSDGCSFKYHLKYRQGFKERLSSSALLGSIAHKMIQHAYHGIALPEAHHRVWRALCSDIVRDLDAWYVLDREYQASGKARTKARLIWEEEHPQYGELARAIDAYQREFLSEDYTWAKRAHLAHYYRWSRQLATVPPERLLLPNAQLVEGLSLRDEEGRLIERFRDAHESEHYRLLHGQVSGLPVMGVPDVFAVEPDGVAWVADYKVMNRPMEADALSEDEQLALYVELLRQHGYLAPGQQVRVGHIYLRDKITEPDGVLPIWTRPSRNVLPRLARHLAYMDRHLAAHDIIAIRGIATGAQAPCHSCGLAHACLSSLAGDQAVVSTEQEENLEEMYDFN